MAVLNKTSPERIPWAPRLEIWYRGHKLANTLPECFSGKSLREVEQALGAASPSRGGRIYRKEYRDIEIEISRDDQYVRTIYHTPKGTVSTTNRQTPEMAKQEIVGLEIEHIIKGPQDYPPVEYIIEHTSIIPTYEDYLAYDAEVGYSGVPIVPIGQDPMSNILWDLIGIEQAYYHLADYQEMVEHLLGVLIEEAQDIQKVTLQSPAKLILYGEHFDSAITPDYIFEKYMLPYFKAFSERLHQQGKLLACHADADTSRLLDLIKLAGFDLAECFVTAPMVKVTMEQARKVWGNQVIIWGGIPSSILCDPFSEAEFESYVISLFRTIAPGDAFILGVADNVVMEAKFERLQWISSFVNEWGKYPIDRQLIS